jgi:hypothetical protein
MSKELQLEVIDILELYPKRIKKEINDNHFKVDLKKLKIDNKINRLYKFITDNYETPHIQKQIFEQLYQNFSSLKLDYDKKTGEIKCIKSHSIIYNSELDTVEIKSNVNCQDIIQEGEKISITIF